MMKLMMTIPVVKIMIRVTAVFSRMYNIILKAIIRLILWLEEKEKKMSDLIFFIHPFWIIHDNVRSLSIIRK